MGVEMMEHGVYKKQEKNGDVSRVEIVIIF